MIVMILGFLFQAAGVPFVPEQAEGAVKFIVEVIGVIMALIGRYRLGGVNILGVKKRL